MAAIGRGFKVGDRVRYLGLRDLGEGIIKGISRLGTLSIEFDEPKPELHDCNGLCAPNHGYWVPSPYNIALVEDEEFDPPSKEEVASFLLGE